MTRDEFLACEERQELRYEFDGFQPIAMTGGTVAHSVIQHNLHLALGSRLRDGPCRYHGSDLKVQTARGFSYPDGFVVCSPVDGGATVVHDPVVIFEILSDSAQDTDMVTRNREYTEIASVRRYIMLSQNDMAGTMFERVGEDWVGHLLSAGSLIRMPEIGIEVALGELYEGVESPATERQRS